LASLLEAEELKLSEAADERLFPFSQAEIEFVSALELGVLSVITESKVELPLASELFSVNDGGLNFEL
jgi:hypothetical protein